MLSHIHIFRYSYIHFFPFGPLAEALNCSRVGGGGNERNCWWLRFKCRHALCCSRRPNISHLVFFLASFSWLQGSGHAILRCVCAIFGARAVDIVGNSFVECSRKCIWPRLLLLLLLVEAAVLHYSDWHSVSRSQQNGGAIRAYYKIHFQEFLISKAPKTEQLKSSKIIKCEHNAIINLFACWFDFFFSLSCSFSFSFSFRFLFFSIFRSVSCIQNSEIINFTKLLSTYEIYIFW